MLSRLKKNAQMITPKKVTEIVIGTECTASSSTARERNYSENETAKNRMYTILDILPA